MIIIKKFKKLSEAEMEIMELLWELEEPITTRQLQSFFRDERQKSWKLQTISTFMTRLKEKGLVISERKGRGNIFYPAISFEEYRQAEAKGIIDTMYRGSIKNFIAALYFNKDVSSDELDELKKWLSER